MEKMCEKQTVSTLSTLKYQTFLKKYIIVKQTNVKNLRLVIKKY